MKFKKALAATMAAALVVTGGGFSNLSLLETEAVYAAEPEEPYMLTFSSRTTTSTSDTPINMSGNTNTTDIDVAYNDDITLSAKLSRVSGSTATTKEEVFNWSVCDSAGKPVKVNDVALTSNKDSITFKASKDVAENTYMVKVKVSQIYELNGTASIQPFAEQTIYIDVVQKELTSAEVLSSIPEFNSVYVSYTDAKTPTEKTALATLLKKADGTGTDEIEGTYGTWKATQIGSGSDDKLTAKDYTVALTFTPFANYKAKANDTGWSKDSSDKDVVSTTKTLSVKAAAQHVTSVDLKNIKVVNANNTTTDFSKSDHPLVYNSALSSDESYTLDDIKLQIDYSVDAPLATAVTVKPAFTSSDKSKVEVVGYDSSTKILTLRAVGAATDSTSDITITAYDSEGGALASGNAFQIHVYKGVQESDLAFATNVPAEYEYTGGNLSDVFNYKALNAANKAEGSTVEQKKYLYTATVGDSAVSDNDSTTKKIVAGDEIQFIGYYKLGNNERVVSKDKVFSVSAGKTNATVFSGEACLQKDYKKITVDKKVITKDYIEKAIDAITITSNGAKLSGNTSVDYGTTLTSTGLTQSTDYNALNLLDHLYYLDSVKNDYVKVATASDAIKTPEVGEQKNYVFLIDAETTLADPSCRIGADAFNNYPINFTVKETTLKLKDVQGDAGIDKGTYAASSPISGSIQLSDDTQDVYLYTEQQSYANAGNHYNFEYVWTDSTGKELARNTNGRLALAKNSGYNGTYTCTVTATLKEGQKGQLGTLTAKTTVNVFVSGMTVRSRTTNSKGTVEYTGVLDLGSNPAALKHVYTDKATSGNATYVTPATLNVGVIAASGYKMNATTVTIKDAETKEAKDSKTFSASDNEFTAVEWLLPQLVKGTYEIWLESSSTNGTKTQYYNKKIYNYTVDAFSDVNVSLTSDSNYKLTSSTNQIEYGKKPSEVLTYEFALSSEYIKKGNFTAAEAEAINQFVKANYDITFKNDGLYNVTDTDKQVILTVKKKSNAAADAGLVGGDTTWNKLGYFKIAKKELKLVPVKESYKWTLGSSDNEKITAEFTGFVLDQDAAIVGLANAVDYDIIDKDNHIITISNIGAGEYTVKFKTTEEATNYSVNTDATATLIVEEQKSALTGITAEDITLKVGDSKNITVSQVPSTAADVDTTKLTYKSDDEDIVTVDASGNATAKANGKTTIKVTYTDADNEIEYTTTINVTVSSSTETYTKEEIDKVASENATLKEEAQKAQEAAEEAQKTASAEAQKAAAAQEAKEQAEKEAAEAKEAAEKAAEEVKTAQTTAAEAKDAQEKAEAAQKTAEEAAATAKEAQEKAEAAQKTAQETATAAKAAQTKAETAQKAAEKKAAAAVAVKKGDTFIVGKNIYQITNVSKKTAKFVGTYSKAKTITIPATAKNSKNNVKYKVTTVAASALKANTTATTVTIGKNVTKINGSAFNGCTKLATVTIGKSVKTIGKSAFNGCTKLKKVTIKSSKLKTVKAKAFKIAKKAKVKVPSAKVKAYKKLLKSAGLPSTATVSK